MDKRERSPMFIPLTTGEETKSRKIWEAARRHKNAGSTPFQMHQGNPTETEKSNEVYQLYNCVNSWLPPSPAPSDNVPRYINRISQSLVNLIETSGFGTYLEDLDVSKTMSFTGQVSRKSILRTPYLNDSQMESSFNITGKSVSFQPTFKCFGCDISTDSPKFFKEHLEKHFRPPKDLHRLARQMDKQLHAEESRPATLAPASKRTRTRVHNLLESERFCSTEAINGSLCNLDPSLDDDMINPVPNNSVPLKTAETKMLPVLSTAFKKTRKPYKKRSGLIAKSSVGRRGSYRNTVDQLTAPPRTSTLLSDKAGLDTDFGYFGTISEFGTIGNSMMTDFDETSASNGGTRKKQYKLPRTTCTVCNKNYTSTYIKVHKMKAHNIKDPPIDVPTLLSDGTLQVKADSNSKEQVSDVSQPPAEVHQSKSKMTSLQNQSVPNTNNCIESVSCQRVMDWISQMQLPSPLETEPPSSPQVIDDSHSYPKSQPTTSRILAFKKPALTASFAPLSQKKIRDINGLVNKSAQPDSSSTSTSGHVSSVSKKPFMVYNSQKSFNVYSTNAPKSSPLIVFQRLKRWQNQQTVVREVNIKQEPNSVEKMEDIPINYNQKQPAIPESTNGQQIFESPIPNDASPYFYVETPILTNTNVNKCRRIL